MPDFSCPVAHTSVYTNKHTHLCIHAHMCIHTCKQPLAYTYVCTHTHTLTQTHAHTNTHIHACMHKCTYVHACMYTHTYTYAHKHIYNTHTWSHTRHMYTFVYLCTEFMVLLKGNITLSYLQVNTSTQLSYKQFAKFKHSILEEYCSMIFV